MLPKGWEKVIKEYEDDLTEIYLVLKERSKIVRIYPPLNKVMRFLYLTPLDSCSVVIVGQGPYCYEIANGLAFSVDLDVSHGQRTQRTQRTLENIFAEIEMELSRQPSTQKDLIHWTKQGVLLVSASLTVECKNFENKEFETMKHDILWRGFVRRCIQACSNKGNIIFLLWGMDASFFERDIDTSRNTVLKTVHPSLKEFFGCGHFNAANKILESNKLKQINW